MFISLKDFDMDIFLRLEDEDIDIYYIDFETIPQLVNYIPLGSFDSEGKMKFISLGMDDRIPVGLEFLHRDFYAEYEDITRRPMIRVDRFLEQFGNIPEVVEFFDPYLSMCETSNPPEWCSVCTPTPEEPLCDAPEYCDPNYNSCARVVPVEEFIKLNSDGSSDYSDLYYIIIVYFNGIYRTKAQNAQDFGTYSILTDIDFDLNKYSIILDIKEFFTREFIYYLKCIPGSLPFANEYGTRIKHAIQTKNFVVRQLEVQSEINFFIKGFNEIYGDLVQVKDIILVNQESNLGGDTWLVEVYADVQQDRLVYRLEI